MPESYADHPVSIAEARAEAAADASKWTPRDVLINTLRRLDRGEIDPAELIICWAEFTEAGAVRPKTAIAGSNALTVVGLLELCKDQILSE